MKLVRDRIPEIIRGNGQKPVVRVASPAEYRALLRAKLVEEVGETLDASDAELAGELADVQEVVLAMGRDRGISPERGPLIPPHNAAASEDAQP